MPATSMKRSGRPRNADAWVDSGCVRPELRSWRRPEGKNQRRGVFTIEHASMGSSIATLAIEASDIARRYGTSWALRGVSLRVDAGEVVGLMGANGSGKSTLLRILATLLRPHRGTARVWGHDVVRDAPEVRGHIGYLAHSPGLYDDLTARENLAFVASMLARDARDVDRALERVDLERVAGNQVRALSAGMQRRVALARLIMIRPRMLLLDEPYSNLDTAGIELMNSLVSEWADQGASALVVLHELAPAAGVLDRAVTIREGRIAPALPLRDVSETDVPVTAAR
jgi:heme exporter protein A